MEPIWGLIWFFGFAVLTAVIGYRKKRAGILFAMAGVAVGIVIGFVVTGITAGQGYAGALSFFLGPVGALIAVLSARNGEQVAADGGEADGFKKCPFCAEAVRYEAIKCKHCGSAIHAPIAGGH
jgi:hypothetical protein